MYTLIFERNVLKDLDKISVKDLSKIEDVFESLKHHPRSSVSRKLAGKPNRYRIRKGDYHVIYVIEDQTKTVKVVLIKHRKDVYRKP
jgi:mRNA interferase RelE/StbE